MPRRKITNGQQRIISKPDEDKLYQYAIASMTIFEGDAADLIERKQKLRARFDAFQSEGPKNAIVPGIDEKLRRLTYDAIPQFLRATKLSYRDLLEITNGMNGERATLSWATKIERSMCYACDMLSPEIRANIYDLILNILPAPMQEILFSKDTIGKRVFDAAESKMNAYNEVWTVIKDDVRLQNTYTYRDEISRCYDMIPFDRFNYIVQNFDFSYHWLLGLDAKTCVLAKHGDTELIMDAFCLLPEQWKQRLFDGVKLYAGNIKEG